MYVIACVYRKTVQIEVRAICHTCSSLICRRVTKYIDAATRAAKKARIIQRTTGCVISRKYGPLKKRTMGL